MIPSSIKIQEPVISIRVDREVVQIEIFDRKNYSLIADLSLTPEQFTSALSRLAYTPVNSLEIAANPLTFANKDHIVSGFEIYITVPPSLDGVKVDKDKFFYLKAVEYAKIHYPGWEVSNFFGNRNQVKYKHTSEEGEVYLVRSNMYKYE